MKIKYVTVFQIFGFTCFSQKSTVVCIGSKFFLIVSYNNKKKKSLVNSKYKNLQPLRIGKKTNSLDFAALLLLLLSSLLLLHIYIYIYYFFIYSPISIYLCRAVNTLNFPAKTPIANLNYSNDIISLVLSFKLKVIHLLPKYSWYAHICNEISKKKKKKKKRK